MEFVIPEPLKREHEKLHDELRKATKEGGVVGDAAKALAKLMHPHFVKEDTYALPPLGFLPLVAKGSVTPDMAEVLKLRINCSKTSDRCSPNTTRSSRRFENSPTPLGARTNRNTSRLLKSL